MGESAGSRDHGEEAGIFVRSQAGDSLVWRTPGCRIEIDYTERGCRCQSTLDDVEAMAGHCCRRNNRDCCRLASGSCSAQFQCLQPGVSRSALRGSSENKPSWMPKG